MKYVVCYSGGHSSAIAAIETVRKYGQENVVLLNHNISPFVEDIDIKRFKNEVADYLGIKITYANNKDWESVDQFDICIKKKAFKVGMGTELCTYELKTKPFKDWLNKNYPVGKGDIRNDVTFIYGFDKNEKNRVERRRCIMLKMGYLTEYPLLASRIFISNTENIGILRPRTYARYKHANCIGCLKAGMQHWYLVYRNRKDIWEKAIASEDIIGYTIIKGQSLRELEKKFNKMEMYNIVPTERIHYQKFWKDAKIRISGQLYFDEIIKENKALYSVNV